MKTLTKIRFSMIKERHKETFERALKQGKMDEQMQGLCGFIAGTKNYFTSSCCSGRIVLLEKQGHKKIESYFHRKWHRTIELEELLNGFSEKINGKLWFKVDPFILHIGTDSLENAVKILDSMKEAGVKRGGIILAKPGKYLIELQGTGRMAFPIEKKIVSNEYLEKVIHEANEMLGKNYERLLKLEEVFRKNLE